jgi:hypothetical protein
MEMAHIIYGMDKKPYSRDPNGRYSIKSLRLDIQAGIDGRTWAILPEGFRDHDSGKSYPLPSVREDLQRVAFIPILSKKLDSGSMYIKRALRRWKDNAKNRTSAILDAGNRAQTIATKQADLVQEIRKAKLETRNIVNEVREEAAKASASMTELFSLGRKGLDGQMKAYLGNTAYQGEMITGKDFRECYRLVSQTVKALGLPDSEKKSAQGAVLDQYAAALKSTQDAVSLAAGPEAPKPTKPDPDESIH